MPRRKPPPPPKRRKRGTGSISVAADGTIRARLPSWLDTARAAREFRPGEEHLAAAWLDAMITAARNPQPEAVPEHTTVDEWASQWWTAYCQPPTVAPNTARAYLAALRQLHAVYDVPLDAVRTIQLQAIANALLGRLAVRTVQGIVGVWRSMFRAGIANRLLVYNPAEGIVLPKAPPPVPARHLTQHDVERLLPAIVGHRFEAAFALLIGCGLRIGEVLGLHWRDVDLARRRAWIQYQWTNERLRATPKAHNPHHVPLPPFVVAALIRHRDRQPSGCVFVMQSPWPSKSGDVRPWSRDRVAIDLKRLLAELGLEVATPHSSRHGLATALLNAGIPAADVAQLTGHRSTQTLLRTYSHESGDEERRARAIEEYLGMGAEDDPGTDPT